MNWLIEHRPTYNETKKYIGLKSYPSHGTKVKSSDGKTYQIVRGTLIRVNFF